MKTLEYIMIGILTILCAVGIGAGIAFFILIVMGFFEPLVVK